MLVCGSRTKLHAPHFSSERGTTDDGSANANFASDTGVQELPQLGQVIEAYLAASASAKGVSSSTNPSIACAAKVGSSGTYFIVGVQYH